MTVSTIYVGKDTYVASGSSAGNNYGTALYMSIVSPESSAATRRRGMIEFDISGIPSGSTITNAVLHMYVSAYSNPITCYFKRMTSQFVETTVCWNDQPAHTSTNSAGLAISSTGWKNVTVTGMVQDAFAAGSYAGIKLFGSTHLYSIKVDTRETSNDAYLVITYTPVYTDYYVKTTGDDSLDGGSWANAWATIDKAATTVADGKTVHIGFGTYDAEPAGNKIAPQNIGATGIFYLPETAETGGGTGTVSVEQNA